MRKETLKNLIAYLLVIAMTVCMAACSVAEPAETTAATEAPAAAAPTEPVETKATFVPERYEPTLPPEPTVPETEPTEPATEPVEEDEDNTYYEENNDYTPAPEAPAETTPPAPEAPAETTPPATVAPAPVETTPPETEAPVIVSYDYNAAANYGNSYAASTYGWVVDAGAEGYYPAGSISIDQAINNGGQSYINAEMAETVDATAYMLGCEAGYRVWCDCWESDGWIYFVVYYG